MITCSGPVDGHFLTSFRSECYGFASFVLFLSLLHSYHPLPVTTTLAVYLDSKSLIDRIQSHLSSSYTTPSQATSCDQDILLIIYDRLATIPTHLHLQHVTSHQDEHALVSSLTTPAQANVAADRLATSALQSHPSHSITPLHPVSMCQLDIAGNTLTSSFAHNIRRLAFEGRLRQYMAHRRNWSDISLIDWDTFESFASTTLVPITFSVKFIHSILPSGKIAHRHDSTASSSCPACGALEDNDHVLTCSHVSRIHFKIQFLSHVRKHSSCQHTDPVLATILCDGLSAVLCSTPFDSASYPAVYRRLCDQQSTIGWLNLLRGFASPEWRRLHQRHCRHAGSSTRVSLIGPLASIRTGWHLLAALWAFRNNQRHDILDSNRHNELERRANETIRRLYATKHKVLPTDQVLFHMPLADRLRHILATKLAWISTHSTYLESSLQEAHKRNLHHMHPLTSYFQSSH